jgi:ubiquitin-conjugating enzyme E2 D/E
MSQRRIVSELAKLKEVPNSKISAETIADEIFHLRCTVQGPSQTPYENGIFVLDMRLPCDYPLKPPKCVFTTKIYHPNISERGEICLDILKKDWNPSQSIQKVLDALFGLLASPDPGNALEPEIGCQYSTDRSAFEKVAREYTKKYASG